MKPHLKSIRPFVGARNFDISRTFYQKIGFTERSISPDMSLFTMDGFSFYLQDAYIKDWINNTMVFLEIEQLETYLDFLQKLELIKIKGVKLSHIHHNDWGSEFFLHDPSGVLWHIGNFKSV